jgi:F-type H+-transporting ATPase subunit gamma
MTETLETLRRKINGATELESVVRTMKALAASSIVQYERAVRSLDDYYRTVELGLAACLRQGPGTVQAEGRKGKGRRAISTIVFGTDQGLVGQFNETAAGFAARELGAMQAEKHIWTVGERMQERLMDAALPVAANFPVPNSIAVITSLVGNLLVEVDRQRQRGKVDEVYVIHNRPRSGALIEPAMQRLLPLDNAWMAGLSKLEWPTKMLPEVVGNSEATLKSLVREYLFVSLFRACAESLAAEHASRLAAMQRAVKNIDDLLEELNQDYFRLRQNSIDEELFDVISGFEALTTPASGNHPEQGQLTPG